MLKIISIYDKIHYNIKNKKKIKKNNRILCIFLNRSLFPPFPEAGGNFSPLQGPNGASVSFSSQKYRGPLEFFYLSSPHWVSSNSLIIAQVSLHQSWSCGVSALGVLLWSLYLPVSLSNFKYNGLSCDLTLRNLWRVVDFSFYSPF